jgi:exonuclease SbcD
MRLSKAGIPTLLLIGNHDLSPALGRAHALDPFDTLEVPNVRVLDRPQFLKPEELDSLPLQVLALPWVSRSGMMASLGMSAVDPGQVFQELEQRLFELVNGWLEAADPELPTVLTAHASVQGAKYGGERAVMLGGDLVLSGALVRDKRLDYVALGHIHKPQNLNENPASPTGSDHPPVIYPGSIERVDFGEVKDNKYFIIAHVSRGRTEVEWRELTGIRPFIDRYVRLESGQDVNACLQNALHPLDRLEGAIVRLTLEYPRDWEALIDDDFLHECTERAFEFHLVKRPIIETRIRLPEDQSIGSLTPLELLDKYWSASHTDPAESEALMKLAEEVIKSLDGEQGQEAWR